jgi:hypothetical protein
MCPFQEAENDNPMDGRRLVCLSLFPPSVIYQTYEYVSVLLTQYEHEL